MSYGKEIEQKIVEWGWKLLDLQPTDTSVGITEGWIIWETEQGEVMEIEYSNAMHHELKKEIWEELAFPTVADI